MLVTQRQPSIPGEILQEHYMQPRGVTITDMAVALGCSRKHASNIVHGKARIEASLAMRIAKVFGTTPQFWLNLQNAVDLYHAAQESWQPVRHYTPPVQITQTIAN